MEILMHLQKKLVLATALILLWASVCSVWAMPNPTSSFRSDGVTIDITYPEEAHPAETISYNWTIGAITDVAILNITLFIYAPVNLEWQYLNQSTIIFPLLPAGNTLPTSVIRLTLPPNANGTLYCLLHVQTDQSAGYSSVTFYATQVRTLTYSELLTSYSQLQANYAVLSAQYVQLDANYNSLLMTHNALTSKYNALLEDYGKLLKSYNEILGNYTALNSTLKDLISDYETLNSTYNLLLSNYDSLNSTFSSLLTQNTALTTDYNSLNSTYHSLQENYTSLAAKHDALQTSNNALQSEYNALESTNNNLQTTYNSLLNTEKSLQTEFNSLNSTHNSVQTSYNLLKGAYDSLNQTYTTLEAQMNKRLEEINDSKTEVYQNRIFVAVALVAVAGLVVLIVYLKSKKPDPYIVIRKETVTLDKDENK